MKLKTFLAVSFTLIFVFSCSEEDSGIPFIGEQPAADFWHISKVSSAAATSHTEEFRYFPKVFSTKIEEFGDILCPTISMETKEDGTEVGTIEGNCSSPSATFSGKIETSKGENSFEVLFQGFKIEFKTECNEMMTDSWNYADGSYRGSINSETGELEWKIKLLSEHHYADPSNRCDPTTDTIGIDGAMRTKGLTPSEATNPVTTSEITYSLQAEIATSEIGSWTIDIENLVHKTDDFLGDGDEKCEEALSGTYKLSSADLQVELIPDGESACTPKACMRWSVNGDTKPNELCDIRGL